MFTLYNSKGGMVFLPIDSVLKLNNDPPNAPVHPYNTRFRDKRNIDRTAALNLIHNYSKMEGHSQKECVSEQRKHHEEIELKKHQEETAKRQEKQNSVPGEDFDLHKVNIDEQKRLYEAAKHASKQGGEGQSQTKSGMDTNSGGIDNLQQHAYGRRHHQSSSVDYTDYGQTVGQQQFHHLQIPQPQSQQRDYYQGSNVDHTGYGQNVGQQQFHDLQIPQPQSQQRGYYQGSNVDHTGYGQNVGQQQFHDLQIPHPQSQQRDYCPPKSLNVDPAGYSRNVGQYNSHHQSQHLDYVDSPYSSLDVPHYHSGKSQDPHPQVSHQYEPVPGPTDIYNQQYPTPKRSDHSNDIIPQNRMFI